MVCLSFEVMAQRETAIINPVEPIHYENKGGRFEILSYIKQDYIAKKQSSLNANMDGRALDVQFTDSPDSLLIWLPMIGEEGRLKVVSNKTVLVDQIYRPIIPSDWGYFQKVLYILFNPRIKISLGWILPTFVVRTVLRVLFFQL